MRCRPPVITGPATSPDGSVTYLSPSQREHLVALIHHPAIMLPERAKVLLAINRLDGDRAERTITRLEAAICTRENPLSF